MPFWVHELTKAFRPTGTRRLGLPKQIPCTCSGNRKEEDNDPSQRAQLLSQTSCSLVDPSMKKMETVPISAKQARPREGQSMT